MVATARQTSPKKLAAYGAILTLLGGGVFFSLDSLLNMALKSQLNLDPNGPLFETWKKAPLAATYKFYVFNIDNPEEALRGQKLRVSERGPFTFSQWRRKEIIGWAPDKSTVSYYEYKTYFFEPSQTVGSMDEELVILNPLVASFGATISRITKEDLPIPMVLSPFIYGTINGLLGIHRESLFSRQTVRELLFGKRVGLLDTITTLMRPLDLFGIKLESFPKDALPPNNTVGLLYGKNDTAEGPYEVYTGLGAKGGPTFSFASWQGRTKLKWWKTEKCNMINGSDGSLFKPGLTKDEILYAFGPDICRSLSLKFIQESSYMGIPTYKYSFPENFLVGIEKNPENDCFCIHKDKAKCRVDGIYDLGGCQYGAPLVLTTPHFFAAPHLGKLVDGLTPNEEAHGTFVEIQPKLGAVFYGIKRLMFAARVENNPSLRAFGNIRSVYIPFVWVEESGGLNEELANQVKYTFIYPVRGASITFAGLGGAGAALLLAAGYMTYSRRRQASGPSYGVDIYANGIANKATDLKETKANVEKGKDSSPNSFRNKLKSKFAKSVEDKVHRNFVVGTSQFPKNQNHDLKSEMKKQSLEKKNHSHNESFETRKAMPPLEDNVNLSENKSDQKGSNKGTRPKSLESFSKMYYNYYMNNVQN